MLIVTSSWQTHMRIVFCFSEQVELQRAVLECSETDGGVEEKDEDGGGGGGGGGKDVHQRLLNILTRLLQAERVSGEEGGPWEGRGHVHTALNFWWDEGKGTSDLNRDLCQTHNCARFSLFTGFKWSCSMNLPNFIETTQKLLCVDWWLSLHRALISIWTLKVDIVTLNLETCTSRLEYSLRELRNALTVFSSEEYSML